MPSWWDRFGQEWAKVGLTDDPTFAQGDAGWAYIGQAPPTVEQFNSMFQWVDDKDNWLYGQIGNVITSAGMVPDPYDLTQLLRAIQAKGKIRLTQQMTVFVDPINGNDGNTGAQGSPWRTIQQAIDYANEWVEPAHQWYVIQLVPGTYEPFIATMPFNGGILIQGDVNNPRSYLIKNTNGISVEAAYGAWICVQGISVESAGNDTDYDTSGTGMVCADASAILYKDIHFGPCSNFHMWSVTAGQCFSWGGINYTIYGGARAHTFSSAGGAGTNVRCNITIQNNPEFIYGFAAASCIGYQQAWYTTFNGTARGRHCYVDSNSVINIAGADSETYFPGDQPSYKGTGGITI
jgi:hypothetical protein